MSSDPSEVVSGLTEDGRDAARRAFARALLNVESLAKDMAPKGLYGVKRGRAGKSGGDLRASLRVIFLGENGTDLSAMCTSPLPYAERQHEEEFHHPGLYARGLHGDKYASKYFERAIEMIFGAGRDPLGKHQGAVPADFQELLNEALNG